MTQLQQLSHDSFYNMQDYSQITIDYIEETEDLLQMEFDTERERLDNLGALSYRISTVLDVINPALETDKKALLKLIEIIENEIHSLTI